MAVNFVTEEKGSGGNGKRVGKRGPREKREKGSGKRGQVQLI
jgi:hypothetical protein